VNLLIVDEVSLLRARLLARMDAKLRQIKASDIAFGGIHVVFTGDFHQMPPVKDSALYTSMLQPLDLEEPALRRKKIGLKRACFLGNSGVERVSGFTLWRGLNAVVLLNQSMRISEDRHFDLFLIQLREGKFDLCRQNFRNRTQACQTAPPSELSRWKGAPILVTTNLAKKSVEEAVLTCLNFSQQAEVEQFVAEDVVDKKPVPNNVELFGNCPANKTKNLPTTLNVYPTMRVRKM
jgi:hypothetical protein